MGTGKAVVTVEAVNIDLARETLRLWECPECFALTMKDHEADHRAWHARHPEPRDG